MRLLADPTFSAHIRRGVKLADLIFGECCIGTSRHDKIANFATTGRTEVEEFLSCKNPNPNIIASYMRLVLPIHLLLIRLYYFQEGDLEIQDMVDELAGRPSSFARISNEAWRHIEKKNPSAVISHELSLQSLQNLGFDVETPGPFDDFTNLIHKSYRLCTLARSTLRESTDRRAYSFLGPKLDELLRSLDKFTFTQDLREPSNDKEVMALLHERFVEVMVAVTVIVFDLESLQQPSYAEVRRSVVTCCNDSPFCNAKAWIGALGMVFRPMRETDFDDFDLNCHCVLYALMMLQIKNSLIAGL